MEWEKKGATTLKFPPVIFFCCCGNPTPPPPFLLSPRFAFYFFRRALFCGAGKNGFGRTLVERFFSKRKMSKPFSSGAQVDRQEILKNGLSTIFFDERSWSEILRLWRKLISYPFLSYLSSFNFFLPSILDIAE